MFELAKLISFWLVFIVGCGGMVWLGWILWDKAFSYTLAMFKIKKSFLKYVLSKSK
jgi:TRAP-type C4-dicarboxylate transport system permease small subunit